MTVRVVATHCGRVRLGGSGYAPVGEVAREGGGPLEEELSIELRRALSVANRANNATVSDPRYLDLVVRGILWSSDKLSTNGEPLRGYAK